MLQDRYLAKLMARRWISFVIGFIAFMTRISFMLFLDGISGGGQSTQEREVCDKAFKPLRMPNQNIIWQHSGHVVVCKICGKKFKTCKSINRYNKIFLFQGLPQEDLLQLLHVGQRGRRGKGRFCPAPGRGQTSSTILIRNI